MQFIYSADSGAGLDALAERLKQELENQSVLWLVSGGSNIAISVEIMRQISAELSQRLSVMLADERYGPPGHSESNWQQLMEAGFDSKKSTVYPVLQNGDSLDRARNYYARLADQAFAANDMVIAQLGIGADGHTAGILPDSPATSAGGLVAAFPAGERQRLTMTFEALKHIDCAYVLAFGTDKRPTLNELQSSDLPLARQPAQILKQLPEAYLYSDQLGGN